MSKKALEYSGKSVAIFTNFLPAGHPNIKIVTKTYDSIKAQTNKYPSYKTETELFMPS